MVQNGPMPAPFRMPTLSRVFATLSLSLLLVGCSRETATRLEAAAPPVCIGGASIGGQIRIEGGRVSRGGIAFREEERVGGEGEVAAFEIDVTEVTHGQFAEFVRASGYVTVAERLGPDGQPLGAAVFDRSTGQWRIDPKANWRSPMGEGSTARDDEPVVAVAYEDAEAYARWRGRRLPTEL